MISGLGQLCAAAVVPLLLLGADGKPTCPIVPTPKVYRELGRTVPLAGPETVAIVVGAKASEPERYAAVRLQTLIGRRFKVRLPVCLEGELKDSVRQVILLGQRSTNGMLDRLCRDKLLDLSPTAPGTDGYVIEVVDDGGRQVILIGGSNDRGVIYGQDALFDLVRRNGNALELPVVSIRDWPSIPWRGRPHSVLRHHLVPGAIDAYVRARLNFTDVRDDPNAKETLVFEARKASMGFPAGVPVDATRVKQHIDQSHRRGFFVYGTVSCSVGKEKFDGAIKTFQDLIGLGVDGLWISFDDTGAGQDGPTIVRRVLDLGRQHAMTGHAIAITPPLEEYQHIDREFNHTVAAIPGMAEALWLFTRVPCRGDVETARHIGLKSLPGWWHNLVEFSGGFIHNGDVATPLRIDGRPGYLDLQPLSSGWHHPKYEQIRDADKCTDTVLLWGICGGAPEEYEMTALGLWAWDPAQHNWDAVRSAVYRYVYGPSLVDTARTFDDKLAELKKLFHMPVWQYHVNPGWPCRLKRAADRPKALALIGELETLQKTLAARAPEETAIDPARLESVYLEPMAATLVYARKMTTLEYPEDTLGDFESRMISLIESGNEAEAEQALAAVRPKVNEQLARISSELQGLKAIDLYAKAWKDRVSGLAYWKGLVKKRRAEMQKRFQRLMAMEPSALFPYKQKASRADLQALFVQLPSPPAGQPLVELKAADWLAAMPRWRGAWAIGPYETNGQRLVALGFMPNMASQVDDHAEVYAELKLPKVDGRLLLDAFVDDTRNDNRWRKFRYMQLWTNDQLLWEEDIAPDRKGRQWVTVDITSLAKTSDRLSLRFRVVDKQGVGSHLSVTFLGPVRLRAEK